MIHELDLPQLYSITLGEEALYGNWEYTKGGFKQYHTTLTMKSTNVA